jgi:hypothetical protein
MALLLWTLFKQYIKLVSESFRMLKRGTRRSVSGCGPRLRGWRLFCRARKRMLVFALCERRKLRAA